MNWKLIFQLSLFGLAMAFGTISLIPSKIVEPTLWLIIIIICSFLIAKNCNSKYFLHGFLVSLVNCVWITGAHILFVNSYLSHHPEMVSFNARMPMPNHPRWMMLITGPIAGIISGLVLGLFAFLASKFVKKPQPAR